MIQFGTILFIKFATILIVFRHLTYYFDTTIRYSDCKILPINSVRTHKTRSIFALSTLFSSFKPESKNFRQKKRRKMKNLLSKTQNQANAKKHGFNLKPFGSFVLQACNFASQRAKKVQKLNLSFKISLFNALFLRMIINLASG